APDVSEDTTATCTATASDAAGNEGTATLTVSVAKETVAPEVIFSPGTLTVNSGGTGSSTLTATDDVDGTVVPDVTCDSGSFANNTYTAPDVSVDTTATCTATAEDTAGNEGTATLTVSVAKETVAPEVSFTPATLAVDSGGTGSSTLTATDDVDGTVVPDVTCDAGSFANNTYTAPDVSADTTATCTATAEDTAGNEGTATLTVSVAKETVAPEVSFTPATLAVDSGGTGSSTLTATDNVGVTTGPAVTCTQGSFANNTYTAPDVSVDTTATCTATASDAAGNAGTATLTISIAKETVAPEVSFSPGTLAVDSGGTGSSTLTATDDVDGTITPTVTCTHGSFANNTYTAPVVSADTTATCTATASDAAGNAGTATLTVSITIAPDTEPPVLTFTPATLLVGSGRTGTSRVSAIDAVDGTVAPTVSCTNRGGYDIGTGMFTAPAVAVDTESVCTATATDTAGNEGTATLTVSIFALLDETPPVLTFSPAVLTADSGATAMSTLTVTDNAGVTTDPAVTCTHGAFDPDTGTYTAPVVSVDTAATCTATASDAAGNAGTATLTVSIAAPDTEPPVPDTEPPVLTFTPATLTVNSGGTGSSTFTATDNVGVTRVRVTCTLGSYDRNTGTYTAPVVSFNAMVLCTARAEDAARNRRTATLRISVAKETVAPEVIFSPATLAVNSGGTGSSTLTATDDVDGTVVPDVTCDAGSFANNTYTAPVVSADTTATCTATAEDTAGNAGTATLTVSVAKETVAPEVSFSPATLDNVASGATVSVTLTATDNVGVTTGPDVTCTQGSFANNTYTAPDVSADTTGVTCTATASDAAGNEGRATLTISVAKETVAPEVSFSPATLDNVASGATVSVTLTATDD
ncbi:MAG: hypothetical protein GDA39_10355, partial [Hyphomonadaceae bacterium]|nr:hypothetical protein [Hyphomonadaceae bacterium]